nr:hypothetical protein [Rhodococcus sp. 06-621-2]
METHARHESRTLTIENTDQNLPSTDIDTTIKFRDAPSPST